MQEQKRDNENAKMKKQSADKWLRILFTLNALMLMSALLAVFLPDSTMAFVHERLGLGELPNEPIVEYLARSCSLLYGIHGVVLFIVARNLNKYREMLPLLILMHFVLGSFMIGIDLNSKMPNYWTLMEGPGICAFSIMLLYFWRHSSFRLDSDGA